MGSRLCRISGLTKGYVMATLLSAVSANGAGTGASHSGPCSVFVRGVLDGATVTVEVADADSADNYVKADRSIMPVSRFETKGSCSLSAYGTYFVRAVVSNAGSSTSVTVVTTQ